MWAMGLYSSHQPYRPCAKAKTLSQGATVNIGQKCLAFREDSMSGAIDSVWLISRYK